MSQSVERSFRFIGKQGILLAPSDLREFSAALRREFPHMFFFVFHERGEIGRTDSFGPVTAPPDATAIRIEAVPEEIAEDPLTPTRMVFFDSLADCDSWGACEGAIIPEDWIPKWERTSEGRWIITNYLDTPRFRMVFPHFLSSSRRGVFRTELHAQADNEQIRLEYGLWAGGYYSWEDEKIKVLKRARRIFERMTTNKYAIVDRNTLAVQERVEKGGIFWIGHGALEWARAHPRHFLHERYKPVDWNPP